MSGGALTYLYASSENGASNVLFERLSTVFTNIGPVIYVGPDVSISVGLLFECLSAYSTLKWSLLLSMKYHEVLMIDKRAMTECTRGRH